MIFALKKIRDYIETDLVANGHFGHILGLSEQFSLESEDLTLQMFQQYLLQAIALAKFVKGLKGFTENEFKTPGKKAVAVRSPERPRTGLSSNEGTRSSR